MHITHKSPVSVYLELYSLFLKLHVKVATEMIFRHLNTFKIEIVTLPLKCISPYDFSFTIYFPRILQDKLKILE